MTSPGGGGKKTFQWQLTPSDSGGAKIFVNEDIPARESERPDMQREIIKSSLRRLGELAEVQQQPRRDKSH